MFLKLDLGGLGGGGATICFSYQAKQKRKPLQMLVGLLDHINKTRQPIGSVEIMLGFIQVNVL